jgi:3-dehydrosphinganine reductase
MTFHNKLVLITGGSSGIGLATARAFAAEGAEVWLIARNAERLAQAQEIVSAACQTTGHVCGAVPADVTDFDQAVAAVAEVTDKAGTPDIVVNSHGATRPGYFEELGLDVFRGMMEVNYFGTLHVIKAVSGGMIERRSGHIVNVSSGAALLPAFGYTAYTASKYALRGLSDVLRLELRRYNIRVSVVFPPDVDTPMLAEETPYRPHETNEVYGGTVVSPDFVARAILNGVRLNHYSIVPGVEMHAAARAASLLGDWQFPVLDTLISRARRKLDR